MRPPKWRNILVFVVVCGTVAVYHHQYRLASLRIKNESLLTQGHTTNGSTSTRIESQTVKPAGSSSKPQQRGPSVWPRHYPRFPRVWASNGKSLHIQTEGVNAHLCAIKKAGSEYSAAMASFYCSQDKEAKCDWERWREMHPSPCTVVAAREPTERFISGYIDKCILDRHWAHVHRIYRGKPKCVGKTILEVIDIIYHTIYSSNPFRERFVAQNHFYPMMWNCGLKGTLDDTIRVLPFSSGPDFGETVKSALASCGLDKSLVSTNVRHLIPKSQNGNGEVIRSVRTSKKRKHDLLQVIKSDAMRSFRLFKMYSLDYYHFGYPVPEWMKDAVVQSTKGNDADMRKWLSSFDAHVTYKFIETK